MLGRLLAAAVALTLMLAAPARAELEVPPVAWGNDFACRPSLEHPRPVVLLHGLFGTGGYWSRLGPVLQQAGYCVFAPTYGLVPGSAPERDGYRPGGLIDATQSAPEIAAFVGRVLFATGAPEVDLVGHSEGTVTPRYYLERLGGAARVRHFVALASLWRGTNVGGAATLRDSAPDGLANLVFGLNAAACPFCTQALAGSAFLDDLNADGEAIPGVEHTNIVTRYDQTVVPYTSGIMRDGGRNIVLQEVCPGDRFSHAAMPFDPVAIGLVLGALDPGHREPVDCQA